MEDEAAFDTTTNLFVGEEFVNEGDERFEGKLFCDAGAGVVAAESTAAVAAISEADGVEVLDSEATFVGREMREKIFDVDRLASKGVLDEVGTISAGACVETRVGCGFSVGIGGFKHVFYSFRFVKVQCSK